jgi:Fic family protein
MVLHIAGSSADGMVSISPPIHRRLAEYYGSLREAQGENFREEVDVTPFVRFHTAALADAAARLEEAGVRFRRQQDHFARLMEGKLNERQITGLMFMLDLGPISSTHYTRLAQCSQATALTDLNSLIERGLAIRVGGGKNTRYRLSPEIALQLQEPT